VLDSSAFARLARVINEYGMHQLRRRGDLPSKWVKELQVFFVNYHNLEGKQYRLLGCRGAKQAMRLIKAAKKAA
jgi:inorganic pyrophosphatase